MKKILVSYNDDLLFKIKRLGDFLEVPEFKVINTSLVFGFYKYWFPYQRILSNLPDMKIYSNETTKRLHKFKDSLKRQIEFDYDAIKDLDKTEVEFEKCHPYETYVTSEQHNKEFLHFLTIPDTPEPKQVEIRIETSNVEPATKFQKKKKQKKEKLEKPSYPFKLLPRPEIHSLKDFLYVMLKVLLVLGFCALGNFVTYLLLPREWAIYSFQFLLKNNPSLLIVSGIIIIFVCMLSGCVYYISFRIIEVKVKRRKEKRKFRPIEREFDKKYPPCNFKDPTERYHAILEFLNTEDTIKQLKSLDE